MAEVRVGEDAGPLLLDFLRAARRRLLIVSPWLSPACADMALRKQREGVSTVIVTTKDGGRDHRLALSRLVERRKRVVAPRRWGLLARGREEEGVLKEEEKSKWKGRVRKEHLAPTSPRFSRKGFRH